MGTEAEKCVQAPAVEVEAEEVVDTAPPPEVAQLHSQNCFIFFAKLLEVGSLRACSPQPGNALQEGRDASEKGSGRGRALELR